MKELAAFLLPPAVAFAGMRVNHLLFGKEFEQRFGGGFKFALGLAVGMLVFTQAVLLGTLTGVNLAGWLAWLALIWGVMEAVLLLLKATKGLKQIKFQPGYFWLLLLLPVIYSWWVFGRLSTLEGTLEFDANTFWVFKAKILYLEQGKNLLPWMHNPELAYAHWDYPMLVPCLYVLNYGAVGGVDEFVNKVWPFWMVVALCLGILSLAKFWQRPHPLPVATVMAFCFLPATMQYIRWEGGTVPMAFYTSLAALLIVHAFLSGDSSTLAVSVLVLTGCIMTKFEGAVYAGLWFCALFPFCWRRGWMKNILLWKAVLVAIVCMLPYILLRLAKPISHPDDAWLHVGLTSPETALRNFPQVWFLDVFGCFFSQDFFHWTATDNGGLQWSGHWIGWGGLVNQQLNVLPWLLMLLLGLSLWKKNGRMIVFALTLVIIGTLTALALITACLPHLQGDVAQVIANVPTAARIYYPYFVACFLGLMPIWFISLSSPGSVQKQPSGRRTPH
jgi:hypothetical protein